MPKNRLASAAGIALSCLLALESAIPRFAIAQSTPEVPPSPIQIGDVAPDFTLPNQDGQLVTLSSFRGKNEVVLAFYVFAFAGHCESELRSYQSKLEILESAGAQVLGVSMDSPYANKAFAKQIGVTFPLLSDRLREVIAKYGVYNPKDGAARRATFLIDREGRVRMVQFDTAAIDPSAVVSTCTREGATE